MSISYPLALPGDQVRKLTPRPSSVVGISESPFTFEQQAYVHQGERWAFDVDLAPMEREDAEPWLAWLLALNGREGTFLLGDPKGATARGSWSGGSPLVKGASQTGKTLLVDGLSPLATAKAGDWFQLGSGSSSYLHKLTQDVTFDSGGEGTLCFWPRLRASPADNAPLTLASPKGLFRMLSNEMPWTQEELNYGLTFSCSEAL